MSFFDKLFGRKHSATSVEAGTRGLPAAAEVESLISELEAGRLAGDHDKEQKALAELQAAGVKAVQPLLAIAVDDRRQWPVRQAAIWLLGQIGDDRAAEPLFTKFVRGVDNRTLSSDNGDRGLYMETLEALKALGFELS